MAFAIPAHTKADIWTTFFSGADIRAVLVDTAGTYTRDDNADHYLSDIDTSAQAAMSDKMTMTVTISGSDVIVDGTDAICRSVSATAPTAELIALVDYRTAVDTTSPILCFIDLDPTGASFSVDVSGSDATVVWAAGGIFLDTQ